MALALGYLGAILSVLMVLPQLMRTIRNPAFGGVAPASWALLTLACLTWLMYGIRTSTMPQIPGNVILIVGAVALVLLVPHSTAPSRRALALAGASCVVVVVAFVLPPLAVGYLALSMSLLSSMPQVAESYASRHSGEESGVSLASWATRLLATLCWIGYALLASDRPILIGCLLALVTTSAVFSLALIARRTAARSDDAGLALTDSRSISLRSTI